MLPCSLEAACRLAGILENKDAGGLIVGFAGMDAVVRMVCFSYLISYICNVKVL